MADAGQLIRELAEYWGEGHIPERVLRHPALGPAYVRERLERLRALLGEAAYLNLPETIYDAASGTTAEQRRQAAEAERRGEEERRAREAEEEARVEALRQAATAALARDFLATDDTVFQTLGITAEPAALQALRGAYVREWCESRGLEISDEQAEAVSVVHRHALVRARAGSGKTHAVVVRTRFLTEHCGVSPDQILILAFNNSAVDDVERKLREKKAAVPHVRTFHALAYQLVRPAETILYGKSRERAFREVALDRFDDPELGPEIRNIMLERFRADWHTLIERGLHLSREEGLALRRAMPLLTLAGDFVKSYGEQVIANFLFEHNVSYGYEWAHGWGERTYRPDFTSKLPDQTIIIEYFGLVGESGYDREIAAKRKFCEERPDCTLVEVYPSDLAAGSAGVETLLRDRLTELGVPCRRLPDDVVWERVRDQARSQFAQMVQNFIGRCRKDRLTPRSLAHQLAAFSIDSEAERGFFKIAAQLYADYLDRLRHTGSEDFDGLLERAVGIVEGGASSFEGRAGRGDLRKLRFVMVDEFQDFAPLYHDLLRAVLRLNPGVQVYCVGDDWQAINAFAGASTRCFDDFGSYFVPSRVVDLATNRRSGFRIVDVGNRVMDRVGSGVAARPKEEAGPGRVLVADLARFAPDDAERAAYESDRLTPAVRRIVAERLSAKGRIALLARTNAAPRRTAAARAGRGLDAWAADVCNGLTDQQRRRVDVCTAHKYKGRDAETIVVVDAVDRRYPLIHPDWVFTRALGDTLDKLVADERCLFYVACTRAKEDLVLIVDGTVSPFAMGLGASATAIDWAAFPCRSDHGVAWVVRVTGNNGRLDEATRMMKNELRASQFAFRGGGRGYWVRTFAHSEQLHAGDLVASLQSHTWSAQGEGLEVYIEDGLGVLRSAYAVNRGTWSLITAEAPAVRRRARGG